MISSKEFYFGIKGFSVEAFVFLLLKKLRIFSKLDFTVFAVV